MLKHLGAKVSSSAYKKKTVKPEIKIFKDIRKYVITLD